MSYTKLPYDFDLLFDIKSVEELHSQLLNNNIDDSIYDMSDLFELIEQYDIPLPEGYKRPYKSGFPTVVWIDNNGGYITYAPTVEEAYKYQRMKRY